MKSNINFKKWLFLTVICFGGGIIYILPYIQYDYYDSLMVGLKLNNEQMGHLMSTLGIVNAISYLVGGVVADKFNVKWLVSLSLAVTGAAGLWFATFPSYGQLQIIMVIYGIAAVLSYWPAMIKAVKMLGSEEEQGRMFGFREAGFGIFAWVFTQIGIWLVFKPVGGIEGVKHIIVYYCIIYFIAAILSAIMIPSSTVKKRDKIGDKKVSPMNGILYVVKMPVVWVIGLSIFCTYTVSGAGLSKLTPYFTQILHIDEAMVASLMSFRMYLLCFFAAMLGGILVDKIGSAAKFLFMAFIALILSMLALVLIPGNSATAVVVTIVSFIASAVVYAMRGTYMAPMGQARIPNEYVGTAIGLISFVGYLPDAFMFSVFGRVMGDSPQEGEFKTIFWICIGFAVVGALLSLVMIKMIKKRQETVPLVEVESEV